MACAVSTLTATTRCAILAAMARLSGCMMFVIAVGCGAAPSATTSEPVSNAEQVTVAATSGVSEVRSTMPTVDSTAAVDQTAAPKPLPSVPLTSDIPDLPVDGDSLLWELGDVAVKLREPDRFGPNPFRVEVSDVDRENGLFVLESWVVEGSPVLATFAVQRRPIELSTIDVDTYDRVQSVGNLTWGLRDADPNGPRPGLVFGDAVVGDLLLHISGIDSAVDEMVSAISVKEFGQ